MLFSSEFTCLPEIWSLMDYIDASLDFFLPMLRKEKGLSDFSRFFLFVLTLINISTFRV